MIMRCSTTYIGNSSLEETWLIKLPSQAVNCFMIKLSTVTFEVVSAAK